MTDDELLTVAQVAERAGRVSKGTALGWIHSGQLVATVVSERPDSRRPRYRVDPADLAAFLASRRTRPPAKAGRRKRVVRVTEYV